MQDRLSPLEVFISCFAVSALGGFFSYLRSDQPLSLRSVLAATFYTGLVGLTIGLIWYNYWAETNVWFLIGVSSLAGLGGSNVLDLVIKSLQARYLLQGPPSKDDTDDDKNKHA